MKRHVRLAPRRPGWVARGAVGLLGLTLGCAGPAGPAPADPDYRSEIERWRAERDRRLRAEDGWLTLVGLHWLEQGETTFGSSPDNDIVLPESAAPARAGAFILEGDRVRVRSLPGSGLTLDGKPVAEEELRSDAEGEADVLRLGELRLFVIRRGERYAIRIQDPDSPVRLGFTGIEYFPADPGYRVEGRFVPYEPPRAIEVATIVDVPQKGIVPGYVEFTLQGKTLRLEPFLTAPDDAPWFFMFKDLTSGKETYGAGRYLYADPPQDGRIVLDFNKAYNPPCVFTPFATCPLPPQQNWLDIRIEAGEKVYGEH